MENLSADFAELCYRLDEKPIIPSKYGMIISPVSDSSSIYETCFDHTIRKVFCDEVVNTEYFKVGWESIDEPYIHFNFLDNRNGRTYAFFFLESKTDKPALLTIEATTPTKIWVNYNLYSIVSGNNYMLVANLKNGLNLIILESLEITAKDSIFIRISDYKTEKEKSDYPCLFQGDMMFHEHFGFVHHAGNHLYDGQPFEFIFFHNHDVLAKEDTAQFELIDNVTNQSILKKDIDVNHKYSIDLPVTPFEDYDDGHFFVAQIKYTYANGYRHVQRFSIFTRPVDNMIEKLCQKAETTAKQTDCRYNKLCLIGEKEYIQDQSHIISSITSQMEVLMSNIKSVQNGNLLGDAIISPGSKRVYFFNPMYNAVNYYLIFVPEGYCPDRKYPLIILHSTIEYNGWSGLFRKYLDEPVIAVDISGRGIVLGSYIGEAAIKIALEDVLSRFSVDKNRIYATGYSNGGGATWAMAEAYPDMFAGVYVVSGLTNTDLLDNVRNMRILQLSSQSDYLYACCRNISEMLRDHLDFDSYFVDGYTHDTLMRLHFNEKIFRKLFEARRNEYPQRVVYKTLRNRHRKAYWVEIHSIADGCTEGCIDAQIISPSRIEIHCSGITGFSITIPQQICKKQLEIYVNGKELYKFSEETNDQIHFTKKVEDGNAYFSPVGIYIPIKDVHKGNGLLDVYLDPLSIVIPASSSDIIKAVALAYSEPYCQGFIPKVYIKYPIINYEELNNSTDISERSYVVIDDGSEHALLRKLRQIARVTYDSHGWEYAGKKHIGKYCIQQIVNNPWNPCRNIHLISFNDEIMLKRNLFTRKLIIPTYINGRHGYLNNDALVFDEDRYHGILDYSCDPIDL